MKNFCPSSSELTEITEDIDITSARGWIFYDSACASCRQAAKTLGHFFGRRGFYFLPLQMPWAQKHLGLEPKALLKKMRVLTAKGEGFGGAEAVLYLARQVWWARPVYWLAKISVIHRAIDFGYRWIARHRGCTPLNGKNAVCRTPKNGSTPHPAAFRESV
jgi:predicted DCC family thiol-disulfide oxidoreductase YuxK